MSDSSHPSTPDAHPETDEAPVQRGSAVGAGQPVIFPKWSEPTPIRWALERWLRDTVVSIALTLFPLLALGIISWIPTVGHSAVLRAVPLVALVLYLPWLVWDVRRAASGRLPFDPFVRHDRRQRTYEYEPYLGRLVVRFYVALFCLPAPIVLALRAPVPGWLMGGLIVLPMLVYVISVGLASVVEGLGAMVCMPREVLDRRRSGNESGPNRP